MASEPQGRPPALGVTDAEVDEQLELPGEPGLARPAPGGECAGCGRDVAHTLKGHRVDAAHLDDPRLEAAGDDVDEVPVYGLNCRYCRIIHPLDPSSGAMDLPGPGTGASGWVAVDATLATGPGLVLVPREVVVA